MRINAEDIAANPIPQSLDQLLNANRKRSIITAVTLSFLIIAVFVLSVSTGASPISIQHVADVLLLEGGSKPSPDLVRDSMIIWTIRLPRTLLGLMIGAALAVSGVLMQGLFRNPLADPGIVGVSAGAGLAAAATIVLGDAIFATTFGKIPFLVLPVGAFFGGLASTFLLYRIATRQGRTSISTLLLAGVALGALSGALTGLLAYVSDDRQLRDLSFWSMGSLGGASWTKCAAVAPIILPLLVAVPLLGRGLNALVIGEAEAFYLGIPVQRIKIIAIILVAAAVGASVASAGLIGFIGIVVPHVLRMIIGPDHRLLLPFSALLGASLLVSADILARLIVAPAELPIGILTAAIGAPFFLWLLLNKTRSFDQ